MQSQARPKAPVVSSQVVTVALGALAMFTAFRPPAPILDFEKWSGQLLYAVAIVGLAVWAIRANRREELVAKWNHQEIMEGMTGLSKQLSALERQSADLEATNTPAADPRLAAVKKSIAVTKAAIAHLEKANLLQFTGYTPRVYVATPDGVLLHDSDWVPPPEPSSEHGSD